jgi:threonine synthase
MSTAIRYYSTNRSADEVTLREALLRGQAPDLGLYLPDRVPALSPEELGRLSELAYPEVAFEVLCRFTGGMMTEDRLREHCADAYNFEVPLEPAGESRFLLRLDRGPTASFKDFAARMMARWIGDCIRADGDPLTILTATSGDTGSAVAHAFLGVPNVRVIVLFPTGEVSQRQRRQMTTLGGNVTTVAVDGKFDDCQAMVKRAFADSEFAAHRLSSANSINIGRLLPQAVYYVYAAVRVGGPERPIVAVVPSGNFGNMMGALLARRMGAPIARIVVATNANDEVPEFLRTGEYRKVVPSRECISNAMNVGHPSNLARLVDFYGGHLDETGRMRREPDLAALRRDIFAVSITDDETRETIRAAWQDGGVLLEPHGAVAWVGLSRFRGAAPADQADLPAVVVETAHPAKFPEEIRAILGLDPPVPPSLAGLDDRPERCEPMAMDYDVFRTWLHGRLRA